MTEPTDLTERLITIGLHLRLQIIGLLNFQDEKGYLSTIEATLLAQHEAQLLLIEQLVGPVVDATPAPNLVAVAHDSSIPGRVDLVIHNSRDGNVGVITVDPISDDDRIAHLTVALELHGYRVIGEHRVHRGCGRIEFTVKNPGA